MKNVVLVTLALAVAGGIAGVVIVKHRAAQEVASPMPKARPPEPVRATAEVPPAAQPPETLPAVAEVAFPEPPSPGRQDERPAKADPKARVAQGGRPAKEPLKDPEAREALAWVGADPEAEEYWCAAINNPSLSAHERQDLIEDLNEDGLSDPKNPSPDDLPLIVNRIQLIEQFGPYAMDQVNADAFAEAYKDLLNLADRVMGGGVPVK